MAAAPHPYEFDIEVDGVPLLVYREPEEGGRAFVCSIEDAAYEIRFHNGGPEAVSVSWDIDSKVRPLASWKLRLTSAATTARVDLNAVWVGAHNHRRRRQWGAE